MYISTTNMEHELLHGYIFLSKLIDHFTETFQDKFKLPRFGLAIEKLGSDIQTYFFLSKLYIYIYIYIYMCIILYIIYYIIYYNILYINIYNLI